MGELATSKEQYRKMKGGENEEEKVQAKKEELY